MENRAHQKSNNFHFFFPLLIAPLLASKASGIKLSIDKQNTRNEAIHSYDIEIKMLT